ATWRAQADRAERGAGAVPLGGAAVDDLAARGEALGGGALAGPGELLAGDVEGANAHAVTPGEVEGQGTPAAPGLDHALAGAQAQLARHVLHLRDLRFLERGGGRREVGAGVDHLPIEPQPVEVVAEVVVMVDVRTLATD